MPRYPSRVSSYAFGPGPLSPAIKALVIANVVIFLAGLVAPNLFVVMEPFLGLLPADVVYPHLWVWQIVT